jgi:hypothetical protein
MLYGPQYLITYDIYTEFFWISQLLQSSMYVTCRLQSLLITKIIRDPVIIVSLARIAFAAVLFETSRTSAWTSGMGANAVRLSGHHNPSISTYGLGVCFKIH